VRYPYLYILHYNIIYCYIHTYRGKGSRITDLLLLYIIIIVLCARSDFFSICYKRALDSDRWWWRPLIYTIYISVRSESSVPVAYREHCCLGWAGVSFEKNNLSRIRRPTISPTPTRCCRSDISPSLIRAAI